MYIIRLKQTAPTRRQSISLPDALPILPATNPDPLDKELQDLKGRLTEASSIYTDNYPDVVELASVRRPFKSCSRSEEHTSELQSRRDLVCRLLLEEKKNYFGRW